MSKKRLLRRYDYSMYTITDVFLETAGTIDLDVEIKFTIGNSPLSIDIHKRFIDDIKDLYKALHAISYEQKQNAYKLEAAEKKAYKLLPHPSDELVMIMSLLLHHSRKLHALQIAG